MVLRSILGAVEAHPNMAVVAVVVRGAQMGMEPKAVPQQVAAITLALVVVVPAGALQVALAAPLALAAPAVIIQAVLVVVQADHLSDKLVQTVQMAAVAAAVMATVQTSLVAGGLVLPGPNGAVAVRAVVVVAVALGERAQVRTAAMQAYTVAAVVAAAIPEAPEAPEPKALSSSPIPCRRRVTSASVRQRRLTCLISARAAASTLIPAFPPTRPTRSTTTAAR